MDTLDTSVCHSFRAAHGGSAGAFAPAAAQSRGGLGGSGGRKGPGRWGGGVEGVFELAFLDPEM